MAAPPAMDPRRALRLATACYVLGMSAHTTFIFFLAPVALRVAGAPERDAWVFSGTAIAMMLAALPAGWLADHFPRRRMLRVGLGLLALSYLPLLAPPTVGAVLLCTVLSGVGLAFLFVSFTSYVGDVLAQAEVSRALGASTALATLVGALGPFAASLVFRAATNEEAALAINAALFGLGALAGAAITFQLPTARLPDAAAPASLRGDLRAVLPFLFLYALMGAGYGMMLPYFAVYFLDHVRLAPETWGFLLGAATLSGALGSMLAGRLGRANPLRVMLGTQILHAAVSLAFLLPVGALLLGLAFVTRNLFATGLAPVAGALLLSRTRPQARASAQAAGSLAWNFGWALGAAAGATLLARMGGAHFPLAATLGVIGALLAVAMLRPRSSQS